MNSKELKNDDCTPAHCLEPVTQTGSIKQIFNKFNDFKDNATDSFSKFFEFIKKFPSVLADLVEAILSFSKNNFTITIDIISPLRKVYGDLYDTLVAPIFAKISQIYSLIQDFLKSDSSILNVSSTVVSSYVLGVSTYYGFRAENKIASFFWALVACGSAFALGAYNTSIFSKFTSILRAESSVDLLNNLGVDGETVFDILAEPIDNKESPISINHVFKQVSEKEDQGISLLTELFSDNEGLFSDIFGFILKFFGVFKDSVFKAMKLASVKTLTEYLLLFWKKTANYFSGKISFDEISRWKSEIAELEKYAGDFTPTDSELAKRIQNSVSSIRSSVMERYVKDKTISDSTKEEITTQLSKIEESLKARFDDTTGRSRRVEPVCFVYAGPAGVGKSTHSLALAKEFHIAYGSAYGYNNPHAGADFSIFQKKMDLPQWDGYQNRAYTTLSFDDPDTVVSSDGSKSPWKMLIDVVNAAPFQVDIDVGNKEAYVNSPFVIVTCNRSNFVTFPHINEPEAVQRRIMLVENLRINDNPFDKDKEFEKLLCEHRNIPYTELDELDISAVLTGNFEDKIADVSMFIPGENGRRKVTILFGATKKILVALAMIKHCCNLAYWCLANPVTYKLKGTEAVPNNTRLQHAAKIKEARDMWEIIKPKFLNPDLTESQLKYVSRFFADVFYDEVVYSFRVQRSMWNMDSTGMSLDSYMTVANYLSDMKGNSKLWALQPICSQLPSYVMRYPSDDPDNIRFDSLARELLLDETVASIFREEDSMQSRHVVASSLKFINLRYIIDVALQRKRTQVGPTIGHAWVNAIQKEFPNTKPNNVLRNIILASTTVLKDRLFQRCLLGFALGSISCVYLWKNRETIRTLPLLFSSFVTDLFSPSENKVSLSEEWEAGFKEDESSNVKLKPKEEKNNKVTRLSRGRILRCKPIDKTDQAPRITILDVDSWRENKSVASTFLDVPSGPDAFEKAFSQDYKEYPDPEIYSFVSSSLGVMRILTKEGQETWGFITYLTNTLAVMNKHFGTTIMDDLEKIYKQPVDIRDHFQTTIITIYPPLGYRRQSEELDPIFAPVSMAMVDFLNLRISVIAKGKDTEVYNHLMEFGDAFWFRHPFKSIKGTSHRYLTLDQLYNNPKFHSFGRETEYEIRRPIIVKHPGKHGFERFPFYIETGQLEFEKTFMSGSLYCTPISWKETTKYSRYLLDEIAGLQDKVEVPEIRETLRRKDVLTTQATIKFNDGSPLSTNGDCGLPWMIKFEGQWRPLGFHTFKASAMFGTLVPKPAAGFHPLTRDTISAYDTASKVDDLYERDSPMVKPVAGISDQMMRAAPSRSQKYISKLHYIPDQQVKAYMRNATALADMGFEQLGVAPPGLSDSTQSTSSIESTMEISCPTVGQRFEYFSDCFNRIFEGVDIPYVHKEPSLLNSDAFLVKIEEYAPSTSIFDPKKLDLECLNRACDDVLAHIMSHITQWRTLSYQEALLGMDEDDYFYPLKRSTSAGYPFKMMRDSSGKFMKKKLDVIGSGIDGRADDGGSATSKIESASLSNDVGHIYRMMKAGIRFPFVSIDNLKDEVLKVTKVDDDQYDIKSTRIFACVCLQEIIIARMLMGHLLRSVTSVGPKLGFALGMDINKPEEFLYHLAGEPEWWKLRTYGAGDFSKFDAKQVHSIAVVIMRRVILPLWDRIGITKTIQEKMEIKTAIETLFLTMFESIHIRGNVLYQWRGPLPSGHYLTAFWNSLYNHVSHAYCYHRIIREDNADDFQLSTSFYEDIYLCVMGDDSIFSVRHNAEIYSGTDLEYLQSASMEDEGFDDVFSIANSFIETRLPSFMAELGLIYTSDQKSDNIDKKRQLYQLTFLKCRFGRQGNNFEPLNVGPEIYPERMILDPNSIITPFFWDKKPIKKDLLESTFQMMWQNKINDNCAKISLYGEAVHDRFVEFCYFVANHYAEVKNVRLKTPFQVPSFEESCRRLSNSELSVAMGESFRLTQSPDCIDYQIMRSETPIFSSDESCDQLDISIQMGEMSIIPIAPLQNQSMNSTTNENNVMASAAGGSAAVVLSSNATDQVIGAEIAQSSFEESVRVLKHMSIDDSQSMDIKQFIKKRFRIANSTFATSDTNAYTSYPKYYGIYDILNNSPIVKNKLLGFQGFKIKGRIVLQINANPFMQGRYRLNVLDTFGTWRKGSYPYAIVKNAANICQRSQLPGIDVNINKDSIVEVPFETKIPQGIAWFHTKNTEFQLEPTMILLSVITPLEVGSGSPSTSCTWDMYLEIDNITLLGSAVFNESNVSVREGSKKGPIESTLKMVSNTLGVFGEVPILKPFTEPAQYISDLLGRAAHIWGWSSPVNLEPASKFASSRFDGVGHSASRHNALVMSTNKTRGITPGPVGGTNIDELSLDFLNKVESWIWTDTYSTSQEVGATVWYQPVHPHYSIYQTTKGSAVTVKCGPPIAYLRHFYKFWRGTMRYRFKLSKTSFHVGRLLIILRPPSSGFNDPLNIDLQTTQQYYHKVIWDIRASDEIVVEVPHCNLNDWNYCEPLSGSDNGLISLVVMDKLVCPETVPQSVKVAVYVSGGSDFEFSFRQTHTPVIPVGCIQLESFQSESQKDTVGPFVLGTKKEDPSSLAAQLSTGEKETSLRAILKCPSVLQAVIPATDATTLAVVPYYLSTGFITASSGVQHSSNIDMLSIVGSMYGLYRGGVRIIVTDPTLEIGQIYAYHGPSQATVTDPVFLVSGSTNFSQLITKTIFTQDAQTGAEFEAPYVCRAPYSSVILGTDFGSVSTFTAGMITDRNGSACYSTVPSLCIYVRTAGNSFESGVAAVLRSAADDFDFQGFLSVPWWTGA